MYTHTHTDSKYNRLFRPSNPLSYFEFRFLDYLSDEHNQQIYGNDQFLCLKSPFDKNEIPSFIVMIDQ